MNLWFLAAAIGTAALFVIHLVLGGLDDVAPFLASDLPEPHKSTLYLGWHVASVALVTYAALFAVAAWTPAAAMLGTVATLASAVTGALCLAIALRRGQSVVRALPQGPAFLIVAALGSAGVAT